MAMRSCAARKVVPYVVMAALLAGCGDSDNSAGHARDKAASASSVPSFYNDPPVLPPSHQVIDVWKLRRAVAGVEALAPEIDARACRVAWSDEDSEQQHSKARVMEQVCAAEVTTRQDEYQRALKAFNRKWLPVMMDAIQRGDLVAEVIMRQCSTTPVFDRSGIESSCDKDTQRRAVADKRLREIGFAPAFDLAGEAAARYANKPRLPYVRPARSAVQQRLLERFRQGIITAYANEITDAYTSGNTADSPDSLEEIRRYEVIAAVQQDVRRAFTYETGWSGGWNTEAFGTLRLNRKPLTPGYLTWGRKLYYRGSNTIWGGRHYWRSGPLQVALEYDHDRWIPIAYRDDAAFMRMRQDTLAAADANIDRYLAQDSRWRVFLIHRVGLHEWVPDGMETDTGKIPRNWQGGWVLEKVFEDWKPVPADDHYRIRIDGEGDETRVQFGDGENGARPPNSPKSTQSPGPPCRLRYSGGKTFIPGANSFHSSSGDTPLGYLPYISHISQFDPEPAAPFAPMDPKVQYPQALVECPQGENPDSDRVRFLLRADNTLIEVSQQPGSRVLVMKHYRQAY